MSAVLFRQDLGNAAGRSATFSKTEMQDSPFLSAKLWNSLLQKTHGSDYDTSALENNEVNLDTILGTGNYNIMHFNIYKLRI